MREERKSSVESEGTCRLEYLLEARISSRRQVRHPNKVQKDLYAAAWLPLFNRTRAPLLLRREWRANLYMEIVAIDACK